MNDDVDEVIAEVARSGAWYQLPPNSSGRQYYYGPVGDTSRPAPKVIGAKLQGRIELVTGPGSTPSFGTVVATGKKPRNNCRGYKQKYQVPVLSTERATRRCTMCGDPFDSYTRAHRRCNECQSKMNCNHDSTYYEPRILKGVR